MAKTWQVVLATIAIFAAGLVTGGATALGIVKWVAHHSRVAQGGGMPGMGGRPGQMQQFGPQLMRSFANQLDLTDEQRTRIGSIVKRTASQLSRERHEVQLTSALAIEKMQDEIAELLTADQRTKFEALIAEQRARLEQFRQSRSLLTSPVPAPASPTPPK
jgi:Spy/CpxP family protein refolding chaperone